MVERQSHGGLFDWIVQRCTAVIVGTYAVYLLIYLFVHPGLDYDTWHHLFSHTQMRIASIIVLLSILWHAWIGLWTVFTDYIKSKRLRLFLEFGVILLLVSYFVALFEVLWH